MQASNEKKIPNSAAPGSPGAAPVAEAQAVPTGFGEHWVALEVQRVVPSLFIQLCRAVKRTPSLAR